MALTLGDNFSYQGAKPLDARLKYATLAAMKAVADATMYDGCLAYCVATDKTYQWKSTNTVDTDTGKWREFSSGSGDTIQVDTLPTAGADELGKVYQYIGSTTLTLTHGYFYECVSDGESTPTYSWEEVSTSKGGHEIKNNGVAVTERGIMNFTDFDIDDDPTNEETDIKTHRLTQAEMSEIMSTLPGTPTELPVMFDERGTEYQVAWYVLANGMKKPLYQKTIKDISITTANVDDKDIGLDTNAVIINWYGYIVATGAATGTFAPLSFVHPNGLQHSYTYTINTYNKLGARRGASVPQHSVTLTVQYYKTTDTPV